ncbi:alpha/beta hydrolase [Paraconexibacter antarcticus]|uniref:Alpha/beta hydrolase n=1 Tax=Paraconexibacter antarcticus TaxID=2949664 RepID=A0ABY5E0G1_9ACTN|nr:alpha/beta hydrolase [Paraconexibacter antarcticus]UTI66689.1 alpha/beta hydrolase [Paraconexibacter antarcticus]
MSAKPHQLHAAPEIGVRRVWLAGHDTRVLEVSGTGPALVLIHGFSDSADSWRPLLARAARAGRRAVAVDLPGFGAAGAPNGPVLGSFTAVARAAAERAAGPGGGAVLVGHSMGGMVAMQTAIEDDGRLAGIVPVATAGLHHPGWIAAVGSRPGAWLARTLPAGLVHAGARAGVRRLAVHEVSPDVAEHLPRQAGHLRGRRVAEQVELLRRLRAQTTIPLEVARIACPVLFVWGGRDAAAVFARNRARLEGLAAGAPSSRGVVIEECGHTPQLEAPQELWAHVEDFAGSLGRGA